MSRPSPRVLVIGQSGSPWIERDVSKRLVEMRVAVDDRRVVSAAEDVPVGFVHRLESVGVGRRQEVHTSGKSPSSELE
jgi:hypothetical protein